MMALYVSSHYKNTPNDLQLMSDAPGHHLFVLIGPVAPGQALPDILCVIQVSLEGQISKKSVAQSMSRGRREAGDLIPWVISTQFQNNEFASLSGARVVRIATHPELNRMGYASRAIEQLSAYYEGKMTDLSEGVSEEVKQDLIERDPTSLHTETLCPRKNLPPLLTALTDRRAEPLHWVGVSFGVTQSLYNFWSKCGMAPVYMRLTPNDTTGEHTCIMVKSQEGLALETVANSNWLQSFSQDFRRRFVALLSYQFSAFPASLALGLLLAKKGGAPKGSGAGGITFEELQTVFTEFDLRRLESYARNLVDYHMVLDLIPPAAKLFFLDRLDISLSYTQSAILLAVGLQHKSVTDVERELGISATQILALFNKAIRKISKYMRGLQEKEIKTAIEGDMSGKKKETVNAAKNLKSLKKPLSHELTEAGNQVNQKMKEKQKKLLESLNLEQFQIAGTDGDWEKVLADKKAGSTVSIKKDSSAEPQKKKRKKGKTTGKKGSSKKK